LKPFQQTTKRLEGNAVEGHHGSVWEALPCVELLLDHLEKQKDIYTEAKYPHLFKSINLAWAKLDDYYTKIDESPAYTTALALHPRFRYSYFEKRWDEGMKKHLNKTKRAIQQLWNEDY
jgi:hypothetical protein